MFLTPEAMDLMLDRMWATAPGALVEVGLLTGDPMVDGVELDPALCPGYARYVVASYGSFWLPADGGSKSSNPFTLPAATDGWDQVGAWECIFVDGVAYDAEPLADPVEVDQAGTFRPVSLTRRFGKAL